MPLIFRNHNERQKQLRAEHAAALRALEQSVEAARRAQPSEPPALPQGTGRRAEQARKRALHIAELRQYERRFDEARLIDAANHAESQLGELQLDESRLGESPVVEAPPPVPTVVDAHALTEPAPRPTYRANKHGRRR